MNKEDTKDYNNLASDPHVKDPVEEGDVMHLNDNTITPGLGKAQDVNEIPDSHMVDGNAQEANIDIEDTAEEA